MNDRTLRAPRDRIAGALGAPLDPSQVAFGPFVIDWGAKPIIACCLRIDMLTGRMTWREVAGERSVTLRRAFVEDGKVFVRSDAGRFTMRAFRNSDRRWVTHVTRRAMHDPDLALAIKNALGW